MAFGLEVYDEQGGEVFAVGRKYMVNVGEVHFPGVNTTNVVTRTFTIPPTVPAGEDIFIFTVNSWSQSATVRLPRITLSGRTATILSEPWRNQSGGWQTQAVTLVYGYYA